MDAFAMMVDINGFTRMVDASQGDLIAQYVRDVLAGGIKAVDDQGGEVVAFMGDAFLAILQQAEQICDVCFAIANDVNGQCEYISRAQARCSDAWPYSPGGPGLSVAIEYGWIDVSEIWSKKLGEQELLIGPAINYAHRIGQVGVGNRCHVGPKAAKLIRKAGFTLEGPFRAPIKKGEPRRTYYRFDLGDIWREGRRKPGEDSYWD